MKFKNNVKILSWLSFLALATICLSDSGIKNICHDWAELYYKEFMFSNNVWGKEDITDSKQCLLVKGEDNNVEHGWQWNWPEGEARVKAYPEIVYGYKPWNASSTTPKLPIKIADIEKLQVTYEVDVNATGIYNLIFDLWLTNSDKPTPQSITHEITIWLMDTGVVPAGSPMGTITINDQDYLRYTGSVNKTYIAFVSEIAQTKGTLDLKLFLDYLTKRGYAHKNRYLASIELGNEIDSGEGITWLRNFEVITE